MEGSFWKTWLVVGTLSVFGCSSLPHNKSLTYEKAVNLAVAIYNSKAGEDCVYRLLEVLAEPDWVRTLQFRSTVGLFRAFCREDPSLMGSSSETAGELVRKGESSHPSSPSMELLKSFHLWSVRMMGMECRTSATRMDSALFSHTCWLHQESFRKSSNVKWEKV